MEIWVGGLGVAVGSVITAVAVIVASRLQASREMEERQRDREEREKARQVEIKQRLNRERIDPLIKVVNEVGSRVMQMEYIYARNLMKDMLEQESDVNKERNNLLDELYSFFKDKAWWAGAVAFPVDKRIEDVGLDYFGKFKEWLTHHITIWELIATESDTLRSKKDTAVESKTVCEYIKDISDLEMEKPMQELNDISRKLVNLCYEVLAAN